MIKTLSVITITKNAGETLDATLRSVSGLASQFIVVDDYSTDDTVEIATGYNADIIFHHEPDYGKQKRYALERAIGDWVLVLDADESLSKELRTEITAMLEHDNGKTHGYIIPYRNHFLGRTVRHGGEQYKMLRLFRRSHGTIAAARVHEHFTVNGTVAEMKHVINHYSYRSLGQMVIKFTKYAWKDALRKTENGEHTSLKKLTMYPVHMFYARFVKDNGYKDGLFRIPLDLGFAYMEFLTYFLMLFVKKKNLGGYSVSSL